MAMDDPLHVRIGAIVNYDKGMALPQSGQSLGELSGVLVRDDDDCRVRRGHEVMVSE
jgi:hypothetical protein